MKKEENLNFLMKKTIETRSEISEIFKPKIRSNLSLVRSNFRYDEKNL